MVNATAYLKEQRTAGCKAALYAGLPAFAPHPTRTNIRLVKSFVTVSASSVCAGGGRTCMYAGLHAIGEVSRGIGEIFPVIKETFCAVVETSGLTNKTSGAVGNIVLPDLIFNSLKYKSLYI